MTATTLSGRMANFGSTRLDRAARAMARLHCRLYERYPERFGTLRGLPAFRLVVRGRSSGAPRPVMLMLVRHGDDLLVCGSNGGNPTAPNWWRNLVAAGEAEVQVGRDQWPVTAREVVDPEERARCWDLLVAAYPDFATYQALTDRQLPIAVLERRP